MQSQQQSVIRQWATPLPKILKRPYIIERDVQKLQESQVVTKALKSGAFKGELENVLQGMIGGKPSPSRRLALQKLQNNVVPASKIEAAMQVQSPPVVTVGVNPAIIPVNDLRGASASKYFVAERQLRCKLASTYRLLERMGWDELIYNHVTARIPGEEDHFLLNPFGLHFSEITASSLVRVDLSGTIIDPGSTQLGINQAGYVIHSAIHQARKDIKCIIHVHTHAGAAVAAMKCGLLPISQEAMIIGPVSYHDYRGIACDEEERKELAHDLGPVNMVMILRNHGLLAMGKSVEEAFYFAYNLVYACQTQVSALVVGLSNIVSVNKDVPQLVRRVVKRGGGGVSRHLVYDPGELEFEALMRMLDNQGYCTGYPYKGMELLLPGPLDDKRASTPGGAVELRREGRRLKREKLKQRLQQRLRELEEQERADLSSEGHLSPAPPPAVEASKAVMNGSAPDVSEPLISHRAPVTPSHDKATANHIPLVHHMTASSQNNRLWHFPEKKEEHESDPTTPSMTSNKSGSSLSGQVKTHPFNGEIFHPHDHTPNTSLSLRTFVPSSGKACPSGSAPAHNNHDSDLPVDLGALLRMEKTAQLVAASTSAAVERLSHNKQLEHTDLHAVNGLSSTSGPTSTLPDHQKHFFMSSSPENGRQRATFGSGSREEKLDLRAVQRAQLTAKRVAQSTSSAVEKLTQSRVPTSDDRPTNAT